MIMKEMIEKYLKELDDEATYYLENMNTPKDLNNDYGARYIVTRHHWIALNDLLYEYNEMMFELANNRGDHNE